MWTIQSYLVLGTDDLQWVTLVKNNALAYYKYCKSNNSTTMAHTHEREDGGMQPVQRATPLDRAP